MAGHLEQARIEQVRLIAFDLDGTLIDSSRDLVMAVNAARSRLGLGELDDMTVLSYVGHGARELMRKAMGSAPSEAEVDRGLAYFREFYAEHLLDHTRPYPGVVEALAALGRRHLAVLTNKPIRFTVPIVERLGLAPHFERVYGEDSFPRKKPDPMGLAFLLEEFSAGPREALMVGDSQIDVQTARNAGTWSCGVTYGLASYQLADCPPDLLVSNLKQLVNALGEKVAG
jgi:phosphoglycolate phosphatase